MIHLPQQVFFNHRLGIYPHHFNKIFMGKDSKFQIPFLNFFWKQNPSFVRKAIGNNEERKRNHSTETQDFNVENPLQQREVKTTGASQQNFTILGVCLQTL
jgi:hypothetical protein